MTFKVTFFFAYNLVPSIYGTDMISIVVLTILSIYYYTCTCFHFDTASSVQLSSGSVQVIMICYSENQHSFVAICCAHVGTIAYVFTL